MCRCHDQAPTSGREAPERHRGQGCGEIRRRPPGAALSPLSLDRETTAVLHAEKEQDLLTVERRETEEEAAECQKQEVTAAKDFKVLKDELSSVQEETSGPGTVVLIEQGMELELLWRGTTVSQRHSFRLTAMKLISEIFHENCDGDGKMTPDTLRELLQSLCDQHVGLWDPTDVDNVLANWADKGSIDFDDFLSWVYHDSAMLSPRDASSASPRHLTINFDVNKTIVMRDKTANKSVEVVINEVLAETSWGRVVEDQWMIVSTRPSSLRPEVDGEELVSYAEFLEQRLPGSDRRKERQKHKGAFTAPGSVGEPMAQHHRNLCKQLVYPDGSPVQVVHAFFRLLVELKRSKRSFSLIFRSFGEDLELVAQELNSFCEGKHPLFPGFRMDGSDGEPDYRFHITHPERFGNFHIDACTRWREPFGKSW
eukprot:g30700.t1